MENTLLGAGIACLIAAVIGGGFKAFGVDIPLISSRPRQVLLGAVGLLMILGAVAMKHPGMPGTSGGGVEPGRSPAPAAAASPQAPAAAGAQAAPVTKKTRQAEEVLAEAGPARPPENLLPAPPAAPPPTRSTPPPVDHYEIVFARGDYDFRNLAQIYQTMIETAARDVEQHGARRVLVTGYDATGAGSEKASSQRAKSVADMLRARGVDDGLLEVRAHGKDIARPLETEQRGPRWVTIEIVFAGS